MTNGLVCSLKVKKITLRQCGRFIKKKFSPGRYAGNIDTFFLGLILKFLFLIFKKLIENLDYVILAFISVLFTQNELLAPIFYDLL